MKEVLSEWNSVMDDTLFFNTDIQMTSNKNYDEYSLQSEAMARNINYYGRGLTDEEIDEAKTMECL